MYGMRQMLTRCGRCTFTAERGSKELGWKPLYKSEHILEYVDAEVDFILRHKN